MKQDSPNTIENEVFDSALLQTQPVVSVLMPTYNHGDFLAQSIDGVISQQANFPIELIIGEDCSTDNTLDIALDYQRRYPNIVRVVSSSSNRGVFQNLDRMARHIRGDFTAYCEGDDFWHDKFKLQKQVEYMNMNSDCVLLHSDYDRLLHIFGSWRVIRSVNGKRKTAVPEGDVSWLLINAKLRLISCTLLFRSSAIREHFSSKFWNDSYPVLDLPLKLHMSNLGRVCYLNDSLGTYRRAPDSWMNSGSANSLRIRKAMHDLYEEFGEFFGADTKQQLEIERTYYRAYWRAATFACSRADAEAAWNWLQDSDPEFTHRWQNVARRYLMMVPYACTVTMALRKPLAECRWFFRSQRLTMLERGSA